MANQETFRAIFVNNTQQAQVLEKLLNSGWVAKAAYGSTNAVVFILQKA